MFCLKHKKITQQQFVCFCLQTTKNGVEVGIPKIHDKVWKKNTIIQTFMFEDRIDNATCIEKTSKLTIITISKHSNQNICMYKEDWLI